MRDLVLVLDPVSMLLWTAPGATDSIIDLIIPLDSSQKTVSYCRCSILYIDLDLLPHGLWSGATRLDTRTRHGLRRYLFSIRIVPPVNTLLLALMLPSILSCRSMLLYQSTRLVNWSIPSLDATRSRPVDEASRCSSFAFYRLKTLLSFLLPIQPSFFVVLVTLASYPYPCCPCRYCCCSSCIMRMLLSPFHARGFSIPVGCSTNRTQYLFRDHFFCEKYYCSEYCYSSRRYCSSTAISSPSSLYP